MVYSYYRNDWADSLTADVMPVICGFLGGMEYGAAGFDLEPFSRLGLLPSFTRSTLEDIVTGSHDGFAYTLCEARLARRTRSSRGKSKRKTVFRGLLIRIELLEEVPSIYFARERGVIGNWLSEKLSSLQDESLLLETPFPDFEAVYEAYTRDPEGARDFITPEFTQGMLRVAEEVTGKSRYVAAASEGRDFYLALPRKGDFLSLGSLFRPLALAEDDLHQCIADLALPRRVIDTLRGM
ncbi:MAG: DUF3137 domain-containing protein, partial [Paracoccaceae bacterium]|nr:DUF3137 domain-containing protein [Paracoccaceae bacterium]